MNSSRKFSGLIVSISLLAVAAITGCSSGSVEDRHPIPDIQGAPISSGDIKPGGTKDVVLPGIDPGLQIRVQNLNGKLFYLAEGTFSELQFAQLNTSLAKLPATERKAAMAREISKIFKQIQTVSGIPLKQVAEVGYFRFMLPYQEDLMGALKTLTFEHDILFSPVFFDHSSMAQIRAISGPSIGLNSVGTPPGDLSSFSGLVRIGAPEFVAAAEADINSAGQGLKVNGSTVNLGITDTGITYNHPTFLSGDKKTNRIAYLKDFTREGRVYFGLTAKFEAKDAGTGDPADLLINADVLLTPKLPDLPTGDKFSPITDLAVKVSPELRAILLTPGSGAKLGVFLEASLQANDGSEAVDINANGKLDDQLPMILIPGKTAEEDVVYFDPTGKGDFRSAKPLADFNKAHDTVEVVAEKFGFELKSDTLPASNGTDSIEVRSASVVGFDAGNHGSHVAGISGGHKTILNDKDDTLARGVAPEATILLNRVCANNGGCDATDALIDLAMNAKAEVINMSLGGLSPLNDGYGVQEAMINRLTSLKNVLFVISAGNSGPGHQTIGSPSTARFSLSVGASASIGLIQRQYEWPGAGSLLAPQNDQDFMLFFSSRGPTASGGFKPNLAAPGTELSSVQLNAAQGKHAGLDVYWGTSMAAPTATGAYTLLLDAVKKYNQTHAATPLTTDSLDLRQALISSAKPFDVTRFDPETGAKSQGQYTWVDEGTGLLNLPAAWKKLFEMRENTVPSAVVLTENGVDQPVALDYEVITQMKKPPSGNAYDGTRAGMQGVPAFGSGVYLDFAGTDTLEQVFISRKLPARVSASPEIGSLNVQLKDTTDEFVLKTVIYGSDKNWVKAGVRNGLDCAASPTSNLNVTALGTTVTVNADSTGTLVPAKDSVLNVCVDRQVIANELAPGDHGALIEAYRTAVDSKTGAVKIAKAPSFTVPVYISVPHAVLKNSTAYEIHRTAPSFSVSRNYVQIPEGTSLVTITLEVPELKMDTNGQLAKGEHCSGVELMALVGTNNVGAFKTRPEARVSNCDVATGAVIKDLAKRRITFIGSQPKPGLWDIHVFGQYSYVNSDYILRVDYLTAESSVNAIEGLTGALNGSLAWTVKEASSAVQPDSAKSSFEISGYSGTVKSQVANGAHVAVAGALGVLRKYPADATSVTITTQDSPGNDIDLAVLECDAAATTADDASCAAIGTSGTSTDRETVTFTPKAGKAYAARVDGFAVKDAGNFTSTETITTHAEAGLVAISGAAPAFTVGYSFTAAQITASSLLNGPLFTSGNFQVVGALTVRDAKATVLQSIPVRISSK